MRYFFPKSHIINSKKDSEEIFMTKESLNSSRTPSDGHLADTNPNSAQTLAASCSQPVLTLSQGAPVSDTASSQTLGQNGPVLLQDVDFIEKLAHFDRGTHPGARCARQRKRRIRHYSALIVPCGIIRALRFYRIRPYPPVF